MALRTIRVEGDPVLGKVCREVTEVTPKIVTLIDDMLETMYEANGVGRCGRGPGRDGKSGYSGDIRGADRR